MHSDYQGAWPGYSPGAFANTLACVPAMLLVGWSAVAHGLMRWQVLAILSMLPLAMAVGAMRQGHVFPSGIHDLFAFGRDLTLTLFGSL